MAVVHKVVASALGVGAGVVGVGLTVLGRSRRAARANASLWRQATRDVADRDLTPPSTVAVDSSRRPHG